MATFFEQQSIARKKTARLIFLFLLAVIGLILGVYMIIAALVVYMEADQNTVITGDMFIQPDLFLLIAGLMTVLIFLISLSKTSSLKAAGGKAIAESLGGRLVDPANRSRKYAKLLDVVEEMAIASGTSVPPVYVLENEDGINAFAAGFRPDDAVIGVTRGAVENLNRDELQAVIAHEFSHILNGDMGLNLKLIGYLAGIFSLTVIGRVILYSARGGRKNAGPILMAGFGLMILGFIGVLIGRMIKAAVSRQREYLADASSIQFTRNPAGIYSALDKIGGRGSRIQSAQAEEASHMFFSNGLKSFSGSLLATHPPIEKRLEAIKANAPEGILKEWIQHADKSVADKKIFEEELQKRKSSTDSSQDKSLEGIYGAAAAAGTAMEAMGIIDDDHIAFARRIIDEIPEAVREAAHEAYGARAVVYCLLFDRTNTEIRNTQIGLLKANADPDVFKLVLDFMKPVGGLPYYCRLPLIEMTIPALTELADEQYRVFKANVMALIEADREFDVSEWTMLRILKNHLVGHFENRQAPAEKLALNRKAAHKEAAAALSVLASFTCSGTDIQNAYKSGLAAAGLGDIPLNTEAGIGDFDRALTVLEGLKPLEKEKFLKACGAVIGFDNEINEVEAEVFQVIGDTLDSPVPPIMPGQKLA